MLIIKIIVLLWVITGTLLGVGFCYSDKSDGYFDGLDNFTLIVTVLSMILIGPANKKSIAANLFQPSGNTHSSYEPNHQSRYFGAY